jgi:Xaa-Pro aminopeptidase
MTISPFNRLLARIRDVDDSQVALRSHAAPFAEFPVEEYRRRYARATALMAEEGLDALILTHELNVRYYTGYLSILWESRFRSLTAVLPRDTGLGPTLVLPGQETGNALGTSWVPDRIFYPDQEPIVAHLVRALREKGLESGRIGMELGFGTRLGMTHTDFEAFRAAVAPAEIVDSSVLMQTVRMLKSEAETGRIRRACEISQSAVRAGFEALHPGMTEKELAAILGATMYAEGAELGSRPTFLTVDSYPGRRKMVNSIASDHRIAEGEMVMVDGGATHGGYATDFIRQACMGTPTADQRRWFDIAIEANESALASIRPGVTGADVYEAGLGVFEKHGLAGYNVLNIAGHGTGMEVHELPWLGERDAVYSSDTVLEPGMVFCVEPVIAGMDGPDWDAGVFIVEDKVLVTEDGHEVLTTALSKELWVQPLAGKRSA